MGSIYSFWESQEESKQRDRAYLKKWLKIFHNYERKWTPEFKKLNGFQSGGTQKAFTETRNCQKLKTKRILKAAREK